MFRAGSAFDAIWYYPFNDALNAVGDAGKYLPVRYFCLTMTYIGQHSVQGRWWAYWFFAHSTVVLQYNSI
jgi:hypothetical protein